MNRKRKGTNAERELIHLFWANDWAAVRVAGSGSMKYPSVDILAGTPTRKIAIEAKSVDNDKKYFSIEEIEQVKEFSKIYGAESWIAVKLKTKWYFLTLEDIKKTETGYVIDQTTAINKGLIFEELIKKQINS